MAVAAEHSLSGRTADATLNENALHFKMKPRAARAEHARSLNAQIRDIR